MSDGAHAPSILMFDARDRRWLAFANPLAVWEARTLADVLPILERVEHETARRNRWAAGFLAYEAAPAFDSALAVRPPDTVLPLLWFGLFDAPRESRRADWPKAPSAPAPDWTPTVDDAAYGRAIGRIKDHIRRGDTYQVNYTIRLRAPLPGPPGPLFSALIDAQEPAYGAFVETPEWALCSASPELFFEWDGDTLRSKPMKGTRPRGLWPAEDRRLAAELAAADKDRAEHVMIVDMVRNDLGRLARVGSVTVGSPFRVEPYPTLWQMTSDVRCATGAGLAAILGALFPAASITGAPKARTMSLIAELETAPRGIYTGALGFVAPGRRAQFNVAIRTVRVDSVSGTAEYGTGGGIVWDSAAGAELEECRVKARILTRRLPAFDLLETLLWTPEAGILLEARHLDRLAESAAAFGFPLDRTGLLERLRQATGALPPLPHRLRLTIPKEEQAALESSPLAPLPAPYRLGLAREPVDPRDPLLYHKTTRRAVYEKARQGRPDCDDALLWNPAGEITETALANVLVDLDGAWCTPPVSCGLLGGVYRADLLARGLIRERVIRVDELSAASRLRLVNSVRGEWDAVLIKEEPRV
jgi:para-aminobenzoate synthetase/4-amino-4-deoxychorismate lyase